MPASAWLYLNSAIERALTAQRGRIVVLGGDARCVVALQARIRQTQRELIEQSRVVLRSGAPSSTSDHHHIRGDTTAEQPTVVDAETEISRLVENYAQPALADKTVFVVRSWAQTPAAIAKVFRGSQFIIGLSVPALTPDDLVHGPRPLRPDLADRLITDSSGDPLKIDVAFRRLHDRGAIGYHEGHGQWGLVTARNKASHGATLIVGSSSAGVRPNEGRQSARDAVARAPKAHWANPTELVPPQRANDLADQAFEALAVGDVMGCLGSISAAERQIAHSDHPHHTLRFKLNRYRGLGLFALGDYPGAARVLESAAQQTSLAMVQPIGLAIARTWEEAGWSHELSSHRLRARRCYAEAISAYRRIESNEDRAHRNGADNAADGATTDHSAADNGAGRQSFRASSEQVRAGLIRAENRIAAIDADINPERI